MHNWLGATPILISEELESKYYLLVVSHLMIGLTKTEVAPGALGEVGS
jgi:hypothetical protein